jgi:hypothetical protein
MTDRPPISGSDIDRWLADVAPEFRWWALIGAGVDDESWQQWQYGGSRGPANSSDGTWTSTGSLTELGDATFKL